MQISFIEIAILATVAVVAVYIFISFLRQRLSFRDSRRKEDVDRVRPAAVAVASPPPMPVSVLRNCETTEKQASGLAEKLPPKSGAVNSKAMTVKYPASNASQGAMQTDDLKEIKGIGPVIEAKLNNAGITTFDQIAAWKAADRKKFGKQLSFSGRIERQQWVRQAKNLSKRGKGEGKIE